MKAVNAILSVSMFAIGTLLLFVGVLTAAGLIGIPIMIIGKRIQDESIKLGG